MPDTPIAFSASLTALSWCGLMTAVTSFMPQTLHACSDRLHGGSGVCPTAGRADRSEGLVRRLLVQVVVELLLVLVLDLEQAYRLEDEADHERDHEGPDGDDRRRLKLGDELIGA